MRVNDGPPSGNGPEKSSGIPLEDSLAQAPNSHPARKLFKMIGYVGAIGLVTYAVSPTVFDYINPGSTENELELAPVTQQNTDLDKSRLSLEELINKHPNIIFITTPPRYNNGQISTTDLEFFPGRWELDILNFDVKCEGEPQRKQFVGHVRNINPTTKSAYAKFVRSSSNMSLLSSARDRKLENNPDITNTVRPKPELVEYIGNQVCKSGKIVKPLESTTVVSSERFTDPTNFSTQRRELTFFHLLALVGAAALIIGSRHVGKDRPKVHEGEPRTFKIEFSRLPFSKLREKLSLWRQDRKFDDSPKIRKMTPSSEEGRRFFENTANETTEKNKDWDTTSITDKKETNGRLARLQQRFRMRNEK